MTTTPPQAATDGPKVGDKVRIVNEYCGHQRPQRGRGKRGVAQLVAIHPTDRCYPYAVRTRLSSRGHIWVSSIAPFRKG